MADTPTAVAVCHLAADGTVHCERNADAVFYAASTIKLGVALALLRSVDAGSLSLDTTVASQHRFSSALPGAPEFVFTPDEIDEGFPAHGTPVTLAVCLQRMIEVSSNEGTNLLVNLLGLDAVNAALHDAGGETARMERLIGDYAARETGKTLCASARDLATVMRSIVQGTLLSPRSSELLRTHLRAQRFPYAVTPDSPLSDWGSKTGWITGIAHDVLWFVRNGETAPEILAVCTSGYSAAEAQQRIRIIGAAAFAGEAACNEHTP